MADQKELDALRSKIDALDEKLQALLNERAGLAQDVARVKQSAGDEAVFYRPEREAQVLRRVKERNQGPLDGETVARLFREVMSACLALARLLRAQGKRADIGLPDPPADQCYFLDGWEDVRHYADLDMADYGRVYPGPIEPDEAAQKRIDEITAELEKLQLEMEDEGLEDGAYNALYERVDALEEEARDLQEAYSAEDLARSGVIASWSGGQVTLHVGLVRPEDTVKKEGARGSSASPTGEEAPDAGEITYPASLAEDLKTERAMALGAAMALHPEATLDLTLFKLVSDVLASGMSVTRAIKIDARKEYRSHAKMDEIDATSLEQVAAAHEALDLSWLDDTRSPADQFAAFRALEAGEKAKLVAFATASTTQSCFARDRQRDSLMHAFEIEIMPDIRAHWTPNAALFNRFKKAWLLKILGEELGLAQEAVTLASSTKKQVVEFCDKLFAEPFATLTEAQRAAVASWCPPMMQTAGVEPAETPEDETEVAEAA